jgi:Ca2+-binding EF-hand superfamily protein
MEKMMNKDPELRPSAEEALKAPWFQKLPNKKPENIFCENLLKNLISFTVINTKSLPRIVKALLRVICYHNTEVNNHPEVIEFFKHIDRNHSGDISVEDLAFAFNDSDLKQDAKKLMEQLNVESGETLTYSDFVVATVDWQSELKLEFFSNILELPSSGNITLQDLKKILLNLEEHELNSFFSLMTKEKKGIISISQLFEYIKSSIAAHKRF